MSNEEIKPTGKAETKPVNKPETKPVDKAEIKPVGKAETSQAGKGSKRRPHKAKQFAANYEAIHWGQETNSMNATPSTDQLPQGLWR
jgi:hypothetical protein